MVFFVCQVLTTQLEICQSLFHDGKLLSTKMLSLKNNKADLAKLNSKYISDLFNDLTKLNLFLAN